MKQQEDEVIDLSLFDVYGNPIKRSTANCYVVRKPGIYKLPLIYGNAVKNGVVNTAAFTNNGGAYSHDFVDGAGNIIVDPVIYWPSHVSIVNSDAPNNVDINLGEYYESIFYDEEGNFNYITITVHEVPETGGNVIISARDSLDDYNIWSWHLWLWPYDLSPVEITNSTGVTYNIMPVNLASKYDSDGTHIKNWFYQWGRPMPLLCPSAWNSTADHTPGSITKRDRADVLRKGLNNTNTFYYNSNSPYNWFGDKSYYNLWDAACTGTGNSDNDTVKTVYDPCPVGWKVPNGNTFTGLSILSSANGIVKMRRYSGDTVGVDFPLSGYRSLSGGSLANVGSSGCVWRSSANSQSFAYSLSFYSGDVYPQSYDYRAYGFSVRPVEDDIEKIDNLEG